MGFAHGSLLKDRASDMLNEVWRYFELQVVNLHEVLLPMLLVLPHLGASYQWNS